MLTAKAQYSLANAEGYFREHLSAGDYYADGKQVVGEWFGAGAERLKLRGAVCLDDFLKLCRNVNPNSDERLTQRVKRTNRRVFYDFTLSPPKSVSIAALVGRDKHIEDAHQRATTTALRELEKFAAARVRRNGASTHRNTGNVVSAVFRHDTSRALDPHLHCHCIIFNATYDQVENRWKALENYEMLQAGKYAENIYYHELAKELRRLGYDFQNTKRGDFEIVGVPQELIERFSKRHNEIDEKTRELLEREPDKQNRNVKDIREHIAHKERARKIKDIGRAQLAAVWDAQLSAEEKVALSKVGHGPKRKIEEVSKSAQNALAWAEQHLFDRCSVANEFELWRHALEHGRGGGFSLEDLQSLTTRKAYVRNKSQPGKVTTRETLAREQHIILAAQTGRGRYAPLNGRHQIRNASLDEEQRDAVRHVLGSRDFVTLFRGGAGTGKTFTLNEVKTGLVEAGRPICVIAPQRQQVISLERELDAQGETVTEFLTKRQMKKGAVVIVDEAGQIGAKQMSQLFDYVRAQGGRLILSGDTHQHGPVEASDAMRAIEKYSGLKAAELTAIRRQNPALAKTKAERATIEQYKLAVSEARNGQLRASFERLNSVGAILQCGIYEQQNLLAKKFLELASQGHSTVVVSQTWSEIHKVNEEVRAGLKSCGAVGQTGTNVLALERVDLTNAQKRDKRFYSDKSVLVFNRDTAGFRRGTQGRLVEIGEHHVIVEANDRIRPIPFKNLERLDICEPKELALAVGDCLQLKANAKTKDGKQIANGELVTVKRVKEDGAIELQDGRILEKNYRQFVRGYAVTSYAAQGKTADFVIFSDSAIRAATNQKQWYVTISRGRKGIKIFTTDKQQLRENIIRSGNRELAVELVAEERSSIRQVVQVRSAREQAQVSGKRTV
jgi:conjugative relaxase-like TrwC/TraI family protein